MLRALCWKECRSLRALWCLMAGLIGLAIWVMWMVRSLSGYTSPRPYYALAWLGTTTFGLIATAIVVAGEREAGTWPLLERLPMSSSDLWLNKFSAAALAAGLLLVLATVLARLAAGSADSPQGAIPLWGVSIAEALAWGMLLSCLTDRALTAATAAGTALVGLYLILITLAGPDVDQFGRTHWDYVGTLADYWPLRLVLAMLALLASLVIVSWRNIRRALAHRPAS